jgi:hypothetical protein
MPVGGLGLGLVAHRVAQAGQLTGSEPELGEQRTNRLTARQLDQQVGRRSRTCTHASRRADCETVGHAGHPRGPMFSGQKNGASTWHRPENRVASGHGSPFTPRQQ